MDILTGIRVVSETLTITKELKNIDDKVAVADLKLKLSEVVDGLLEAKEALQDAKQREYELEKEIERLNEQLALQEKTEDEDGCLFKLDDAGNRFEAPFCNLCYVREGKLYRLTHVPYSPGSKPGSKVIFGCIREHYNCPNCRGSFGYSCFQTPDWD